MRRISAMLFLAVLGIGAARAESPPDSLVQQKLDMELAGFEKDTVLKTITYRDAARLDAFDRIRDGAIAEAKAGGSAEDLAVLDGIEARPARSFDDFDLSGDWQCRTVKVGGPAPLVVYDWFRCRVDDDGAGWRLEKLTGSQRTVGRFFNDGDSRQIYLGAFHVAGDPLPSYGAGPASDQAGYVLRDGEQTWRIEFPAPAYESKLDILEFRPAR